VVAAINGHRTDRDVTRSLVARIATGESGDTLRAHVAAWRRAATAEEVEEAVQQACMLAERACHGQTEREVFVWLRTTARRELAHVRERAQREVLVDAADLQAHAGIGLSPAPVDELIDREEDAEVVELAQAVLGRLTERQREIAALHVRGRRRPQIAAHLGMTPRSVKRQLEQIMTVGRDELVRLAGHGCPTGQAMVARLAFGLARPRETRNAQLHLATCPQCGLLYERLDDWREKVAILLPIPAVQQAQPGLVEVTVHRFTEAVASLKHHGHDGVTSLRQQAVDGGAHIKQYGTTAYYRAVDPTPIAGLRPGAAAAALASCLAIGGGATYCVSQNVNPIGVLTQVLTPAAEKKREPPKKRRAQVQPSPTPTPTTPVATPTAAPPTPTPEAPKAEPTPKPTAEPTPPPAPEDEYEPVTGTAATTTQQQPAATPQKPAPAPANGPGEFDGP
jgi:RNA polymerase sigma factor (sigma-70 family)